MYKRARGECVAALQRVRTCRHAYHEIRVLQVVVVSAARELIVTHVPEEPTGSAKIPMMGRVVAMERMLFMRREMRAEREGQSKRGNEARCNEVPSWSLGDFS